MTDLRNAYATLSFGPEWDEIIASSPEGAAMQEIINNALTTGFRAGVKATLEAQGTPTTGASPIVVNVVVPDGAFRLELPLRRSRAIRNSRGQIESIVQEDAE